MGARGDGPDAHDDARQSSTRRRRRATTADTSPVMPIALVTAFDAHATMAEARCTLPATAAVDGNPDSLHRLVPLVSALRAIARNVPGTDMTDEDIQQTLQIAATSLESVVLKSWHRGQRGRKSRVRHEATTDEIIAQLEAVQKRKENDPERKQRAIDALNRRLKYVKKLQRKMERGELLKYTFTVRNLMDVIKALFHQKKKQTRMSTGPIAAKPRTHHRRSLAGTTGVRKQSVRAGAVPRKRGARSQAGAAGDNSESESESDDDSDGEDGDDDDAAHDEEPQARITSGNVMHSPNNLKSRSHAPAAAKVRTDVQRSKRAREKDSELREQTKRTEKRRKSTRCLAGTSTDSEKNTENVFRERTARRATATGVRHVKLQAAPSQANSAGDDIFGCASCRGRLTGCNRCYKFHADGKEKMGISACGYPTWGFPHA